MFKRKDLDALLLKEVTVKFTAYSGKNTVADLDFTGMLQYMDDGIYCVGEISDVRGIGIIYLDINDTNCRITVRPKIIYIAVG